VTTLLDRLAANSDFADVFLMASIVIQLAIAIIILIAATIWADQLRIAKNRFEGWPFFVFLFSPLVLILWALPALPIDHPNGQAALTARGR
jgi:hypothetical protein